MDETNRMQLVLLELLKVFHDYCILKNLKYYAVAGTALGAARHSGFIPWDDDLDVGMPRNDYEKLIESFNKDFKEKNYYLEGPQNSLDPTFPYPFSKLYDLKTTLVEDFGRKQIKRGFFLDIFPLDGIGKDLEEGKKTKGSIQKWHIIKNLYLYGKDNDIFVKRLCKQFCRSVIHLIFRNERGIARIIDEKSKKNDYDKSNYVAALTCYELPILIPKFYLGTPTLHKFEEIMIYCPEKIDEYLTLNYGNWRAYPPEAERVPHHTAALYSLVKGYEDE